MHRKHRILFQPTHAVFPFTLSNINIMFVSILLKGLKGQRRVVAHTLCKLSFILKFREETIKCSEVQLSVLSSATGIRENENLSLPHSMAAGDDIQLGQFKLHLGLSPWDI